MMRSNSYNNKNGSRYTGGAGGAAEDERDQLLTPGEHRSGAGGSGSDLEIGNHVKSQRESNKKDKHNRRNSNGLLGFSRHSESRQMAGKERTLCLVATSLFVVLTVVLLIAARAIPNPFDRSPYLDPTDPNDPHQNPGKGGKGGPHVVVPIGGPQLPPPTDLPRNDAYLIKAEKGAVASEDVDCSKMGVDVLKEGGNAVDAAVATCICIGVLNSFSSGIGGGGFMMIRVPEESQFTVLEDAASQAWSVNPNLLSLRNDTTHSVLKAIDFRETSPAASHKDMYIPIPGSSQVGGLAVGVPGELRGLWTAYEQFGSGRISWERLLTPSVKLSQGWRVSRELARRFRIFGAFMEEKEEWADVFRPRGAMLVEGDWLRRTNYSKTLEYIAQDGIDSFYGHGEDPWIAQAMVDAIAKEGGVLSMDDLQGYAVEVYDPIKSTYHGNTIYTTDAPSCGPVMLGMLNVLEHYNFSSSDSKLSNKTRTALNQHRVIEAMKYGFAARTEIGDIHDSGEDAKSRRERIDYFSSKSWAEEVYRNMTDDTTHTASHYNPVFDVPVDSGTTHMSVIDKWGGACSLTSTVNLIFGSRVMDPVTGIIMNDEQDDFSTPGKINAFGLAPSPYNYPQPGKRPLSSTAATIVERPDGTLYTALGGSGGSRIFGAVAQVLLNLEWGMDVSAAIEAPRLHDQLYPALVTVETGFEQEFTDVLREKNHNVTYFDINLGVAEVQAVLRSDDGAIFAASDSRKNGRAWGY
ncbi:hypothetical protein QFC20_003365 [Naganishia adeliensis]|uniref:Uncharacterized protein n=1 Tax=Naganishia adeliensis TaxID=92952 RepID=A0ACC2WB86_9TREE|nr:hypothetical protein QFC20_003365 [Naganishia adeliensis]